MKEKEDFGKWFIAVVILLCVGIYFFLELAYQKIIPSIVITLLAFFLFIISRKESLHEFMLVLLVSSTLFLSLEISFDLGIWTNLLITLVSIVVIWMTYRKITYHDKYALIIFLWFIVIWLILACNVLYRDDWLMENYLTIPFLVLIFISIRYFKLSALSYSLIFIYLFTHIIGSHYTYSEVPFGFWLQSALGMARNHYDRIVHFGFGFLLAYPLREVAIRIANVKGFWALYLPVEFTLAFSCVYELIEWGIAVIFGGDLGVAYLGTQGDVWDAQKDMFLAGLGSVVTMAIVFFSLMYLKPKEYKTELKTHLKIKHTRELGERVLVKLLKKKKKGKKHNQ